MSSNPNTKPAESPSGSTAAPSRSKPKAPGGFSQSKDWMQRQFPNGQPLKTKGD